MDANRKTRETIGILHPGTIANWNGVANMLQTDSYTPPLGRSLASIITRTVCLTLPTIASTPCNAGPLLHPIHVSDGDFVRAGKPFKVWGVNYDHKIDGGLLEDYWIDEWDTVVEDFDEIKRLGANVVRIHLQVARIMDGPDTPNPDNLAQLAKAIKLAEDERLYLDITGLGCYHKADVPAWYHAMNETERWTVQARFWEAVAQVANDSPAVFCYNLMNEPVLPGLNKPADDWLIGEFGGKHFVQHITLDLAGRTRKAVARAWVNHLTAAIRKHDPDTLITVGVIPWVHVFPKAKPLFYAPEVAENLDFVSVHFYPKRGEVAEAVTALKAYDIGKPVVVEEMFPLKCSIEELAQFIDQTKSVADGYIGFYWGKTPEEYADDDTMASALMGKWLTYFRTHNPYKNP